MNAIVARVYKNNSLLKEVTAETISEQMELIRITRTTYSTRPPTTGAEIHEDYLRFTSGNYAPPTSPPSWDIREENWNSLSYWNSLQYPAYNPVTFPYILNEINPAGQLRQWTKPTGINNSSFATLYKDYATEVISNDALTFETYSIINLQPTGFNDIEVEFTNFSFTLGWWRTALGGEFVTSISLVADQGNQIEYINNEWNLEEWNVYRVVIFFVKGWANMTGGKTKMVSGGKSFKGANTSWYKSKVSRIKG